eukprot:COSAG05_NODE_2846_length_2578_cov_2.353368_2_plen_127_part_00
MQQDPIISTKLPEVLGPAGNPNSFSFIDGSVLYILCEMALSLVLTSLFRHTACRAYEARAEIARNSDWYKAKRKKKAEEEKAAIEKKLAEAALAHEEEVQVQDLGTEVEFAVRLQSYQSVPRPLDC